MDKATLRQYRSLLREIDELEQEKQRVLERYLSPGQPTGMPGAGGKDSSLEDTVVRRMQYQRVIDDKLDVLISLRQQIEAAIGSLPSDERRLIRLYYIDGLRWERVALEINYSVQHVWRLHGQILERMRQDERQ